mgnify:CR=1 FL=1
MDALSELETLVLSEVFYAFYRMNSIRRAADWWQVMEGIYGKAEADEERPPEEKEGQDEPPEVDS